MRKIKFDTTDPKLGLTKSVGFIWSDEKGVYLEYQVSDTIIELYKSKIKDVFIPYSQIADILYKKLWFKRGQLVIKLSSLKGLGKIPLLESTDICVAIKKNQKENCLDFVSNTKLDLSTAILDAVGD